MQETILVLSPSGKQAALIARTLRCREVFCLPMPFGTPVEQIMAHSPHGVIIAADGAEETLDELDFSLLTQNVPVLVLGGAAAHMCVHFGGSAEEACQQRQAVTLGLTDDRLFNDIDGGERLLRGLAPLALPEVLSPIATATERVIGFRHNVLPLYAMEYTVERNDPDASQLLYNFACGVCGCSACWTDDAIIDRAVEAIRASAPEGRVLCAVSGGVDSAVCAKLASMALGERLMCVFVDTGMFRQDEPDEVIRTYMDSMGLVAAHVDAQELFLRALSGVTNPRDKERIASQLMTQVLIKQLGYDPQIRTIVMGTNFNDAILGEVPASDLNAGDHTVAVCQPIRDLYKDEVRRLAAALDLPEAVRSRQPFPSSGLALRVMASVTQERLDLLRKADAIFRAEILEGGHDRRLWQYYATLVESPDQPGSYAVCLRATQASQGGAISARLPFDVLERASQRIRTEVSGVTRIVYDLTPSLHYGELE